MNQFCLAGKIASIPELKTNPQGWKTCSVLIEVERPFANSKGEFESNLMSLEVWRGAAETLASCARLNAWITAKGRIQSRPLQKDGRTVSNVTLIAEKIEYIH